MQLKQKLHTVFLHSNEVAIEPEHKAVFCLPFPPKQREMQFTNNIAFQKLLFLSSSVSF